MREDVNEICAEYEEEDKEEQKESEMVEKNYDPDEEVVTEEAERVFVLGLYVYQHFE